jgi:NADPH-dependent curcumin reductase CurA
METSQFVLASKPIGLLSAGNFRIEKAVPGELQDNEVILKSWYISVDLYMRGLMNILAIYSTSLIISVGILRLRIEIRC